MRPCAQKSILRRAILLLRGHTSRATARKRRIAVWIQPTHPEIQAGVCRHLDRHPATAQPAWNQEAATVCRYSRERSRFGETWSSWHGRYSTLLVNTLSQAMYVSSTLSHRPILRGRLPFLPVI
ncbi:hypothetical protein PsYK624_126770 [Phanerochaete sordida]|uniref:Uncharacterized protein n=1 Tax=Phanerochaete sordida TaxID=48140 RepID=A0A9P3GN39_9APHY|nr:hypothetical protein PsYK624_126770 [Phanerochaete sordida]